MIGFTVYPVTFEISTNNLAVDSVEWCHRDQVTVRNTHTHDQFSKVLQVVPSNSNIEFEIGMIGELDTDFSSISELSIGLSDGSKLIIIRRLAAGGSRVFNITSHLKNPGPKGVLEFKDSSLLAGLRGVVRT